MPYAALAEKLIMHVIHHPATTSITCALLRVALKLFQAHARKTKNKIDDELLDAVAEAVDKYKKNGRKD